jgi:glycosyltransferase involved in cell wall biosynthesis
MASPYRILMLTNRYLPAVGGAELQASQLINRLQLRGHTVCLVTRRLEPNWPERETINNVEIHRLSPVGLSHRANAIMVFRLFIHLLTTARRFDVIHVHGLGPIGLAAILAGVIVRRPVIIKVATQGDILRADGSRSTYSRLVRHIFVPAWLWRSVLSRANRIVAISDGIRAEAHEFGLDNVVVIPNGVAVDRFHIYDRKQARQQLGLDADKLYLIFTGRLVQRKRIDILLSSMPSVLREFPNCHVLLAGSGSGQADTVERELREQVRSLGLENHVHFLGLRDDIELLLCAADLFVFPSEREGMPNAVLEAVAAGVPIVASRIDGVIDILNDEIGWLIPPGDAEALSEAILTILPSPEQAQQRAHKAQQHVTEKFSLDVIAQQYERLYTEVIR